MSPPFPVSRPGTSSAVFGARKNVILPRFDSIGPQTRLDPNAPVVEAYLGGRKVFLARRDPSVQSSDGMPSDYTVPLTVSRMRRARDIELDRATSPYEPSQLVGLHGAAEDYESANNSYKIILGLIFAAAGYDLYRHYRKKSNSTEAAKKTALFMGAVGIAGLMLNSYIESQHTESTTS